VLDDSLQAQLVRAVLRDVEGLQRALTVQQLVPNQGTLGAAKQTTPTMAWDFSSSYEGGTTLEGVLAHHALTDHYLRLGVPHTFNIWLLKVNVNIFIMIFLREEGTCLD